MVVATGVACVSIVCVVGRGVVDGVCVAIVVELRV